MRSEVDIRLKLTSMLTTKAKCEVMIREHHGEDLAQDCLSMIELETVLDTLRWVLEEDR